MVLHAFCGHETEIVATVFPRYIFGTTTSGYITKTNPYNGSRCFVVTNGDYLDYSTLPDHPSEDIWVHIPICWWAFGDTDCWHTWMYMADPTEYGGKAGYVVALKLHKDNGLVTVGLLSMTTWESAEIIEPFATYSLDPADKNWHWLACKFHVDDPFEVEIWLDGTKRIDFAGNPGETGTAEAPFHATDIRDSSKAWTPGEWVGYCARITAGTGAGQTRMIYGNSDILLSITPNWNTTPDATSDFEILTCDDGEGEGVHPPVWHVYELSYAAKGGDGEIGMGYLIYHDVVDDGSDFHERLHPPGTEGDEDAGPGQDIIAYPAWADVTGWKEWTPSAAVKHYSLLDGFNENPTTFAGDVTLTDAETGKELFKQAAYAAVDAESDTPTAVIISMRGERGWIGRDPSHPHKHIAWVDGEDREEYTLDASIWLGSQGALVEWGKLYLLTPGGNAWNKDRLDKLHVGFRQDTATDNRKVYHCGVEVIGRSLTAPPESTVADRDDVAEPSGAAPPAGYAHSQAVIV